MATPSSSGNPPKSWIPAANDPASGFSLANLPLGILRRIDEEGDFGALATVVGDQAIDLTPLIESGVFDDCEHLDELEPIFEDANWTAGHITRGAIREVRSVLQRFFTDDGPAGGQQARRIRAKCQSPLDRADWYLPATMMNYTDFYASVHHARNVGSMFRPDNPLLPNYKHIPIGYHGRASSLVVSGSEIKRPSGQTNAATGDAPAAPTFGPCKRLDYELEVGCVVGVGTAIGQTIPVESAMQHILGLCLVNDWSARDIQAWEYQPLGPFLAKNFATSVSPLIITLDALEPYRIPLAPRPAGDPQPLPYLQEKEPGGFDIQLVVKLASKKMSDQGIKPVVISRGNFKEMYWTFAQMLAHHASGGCNLLPGDLLASGTVSGEAPDSRGCLLELTWDGNGPDGKPKPRKPITLPTGEVRTFLEDGDEVIFEGFCQRDGLPKLSFGECRGRIV